MFDPPHIGHVVLAAEARWQLGLDEVRLVPTGDPPHRDGGWLSSHLRYRLVEAAVAGQPGLVASRVEIDRSGESYTVDTLTHLAAAEPDVDWWLVIGADQLEAFPTWRDPDGILARARLGVAARGDVDAGDLRQLADRVAPGTVDLIAMPTIGVSSTMVRERIHDGAPVAHLLPPAVHELLVREGLIQPTTTLP